MSTVRTELKLHQLNLVRDIDSLTALLKAKESTNKVAGLPTQLTHLRKRVVDKRTSVDWTSVSKDESPPNQVDKVVRELVLKGKMSLPRGFYFEEFPIQPQAKTAAGPKRASSTGSSLTSLSSSENGDAIDKQSAAPGSPRVDGAHVNPADENGSGVTKGHESVEEKPTANKLSDWLADGNENNLIRTGIAFKLDYRRLDKPASETLGVTGVPIFFLESANDPQRYVVAEQIVKFLQELPKAVPDDFSVEEDGVEATSYLSFKVPGTTYFVPLSTIYQKAGHPISSRPPTQFLLPLTPSEEEQDYELYFKWESQDAAGLIGAQVDIYGVDKFFRSPDNDVDEEKTREYLESELRLESWQEKEEVRQEQERAARRKPRRPRTAQSKLNQRLRNAQTAQQKVEHLKTTYENDAIVKSIQQATAKEGQDIGTIKQWAIRVYEICCGYRNRRIMDQNRELARGKKASWNNLAKLFNRGKSWVQDAAKLGAILMEQQDTENEVVKRLMEGDRKKVGITQLLNTLVVVLRLSDDNLLNRIDEENNDEDDEEDEEDDDSTVIA